MLYLQRADIAKRHYASIVHVDTVYNGIRKGPFMKLDADGMANFIENFYQKAGVDPADVQYVETHGCGIKVSQNHNLICLLLVRETNLTEFFLMIIVACG